MNSERVNWPSGSGTNYGSMGNGASVPTSSRNSRTPFDSSIFTESMIENLNEPFINQIRYQSQNRPLRSIFRMARSRRRPILRTKSESDFRSLLRNDKVEDIRDRLIEKYGRSQKTFTIKSISKLSRSQKLVLASIALVDFTSFCAMSILAPFFPNEAANKGVATSVSGFVFSIYALVVFLASPLMGKLVGHVGPKFLLITGIFLGGGCQILFGLLDRVESKPVFIMYCFLVRIFEALGAAAFATASYTFVAKIFPDNIGSVLGLLETFVGLGLSVGPAIGGLLYDLGGYQLPFFTLGGVMLLTIPLNLYLLPSSEYDEDSMEKTHGIWHLLKEPPVIILCFVIVVASNTWGFLDPTLEPHLREFNLSAKQLGLFFLLSSLLYAVSSPFWGFMADRMTQTYVLMVVGLVFSAFGLLLIGPSPLVQSLGLENSIWLNIVALIILGTAISMVLLPTFEAILDYALEAGYKDETSTYGIIAGLWSSMYSLGEVIGPSLGGFLMEHYGFPICSSVMAALCIIIAMIVLLYFTFNPQGAMGIADTIRRNSSRERNSEKLSDSGISGESSKSSSSSTLDVLNETSPLLSKSVPGSFERRKSELGDREFPVGNQSYEGKSFEYGTSFPQILKTVGVTATGAVEV